MTLLATVDWTTVIATAIAAFPATLAAAYSLLTHRAIRTPSGRTIGRQVESLHHTAISNHMLLRRANGLPDIPAEEADE